MVKKIALIGPAYPYRGGIAQYTNELHAALSKEVETTLYSFKRLYPSWLYPGSSDKEIDNQKENTSTRRILDVYNPLSVGRVCRDIENEGFEVVIITWWTLFWQPAMAFIARRLSRKGIKTVFLCHNLYDHDGSGLKQKISKKLLSAPDGYIVHSKDEEEVLHGVFPQKPVLRRLLPIYTQFPEAIQKIKKRGSLEILFFGLIRPYKGLEILLDSLALLKSKDVHLTIVGEYWGDKDELEAKIAGSNHANIETHIEYVSAEAAANYFSRADVVALPYLSATGSAVLSVAYHYGTPVVASSIGGLKDGVVDGKTGWLVEPGSAESLAGAIDEITREKALSMRPRIELFCKENSWEAMAVHIKDFTNELLRDTKS